MPNPVYATLSPSAAAAVPWPVVVVGAGPAGATVARGIARAGQRVLLLDRSHFPRHKVCGCCLNNAGLAALEAAGLRGLPGRLGARPLHELHWSAGGAPVRIRLPGGVAVSRAALDAALVSAAIEAGAEFLPGVGAKLMPRGIDSVPGQRELLLVPGATDAKTNPSRANRELSIHARLVVAADGLSGRLLDLEPIFSSGVGRNARMGLGTRLENKDPDYPDGKIFMASQAGGYVGLVRLETGELDIAAALDPAFLRRAAGPAAAVATILRDAGMAVPAGLLEAGWQGTPLLTRRRSCLGADCVLVVGDAAGYVEPFTGEGMAWALHSAWKLAPLALAASEAWSSEIAADWTRTRAALLHRRQLTCRRIASLLRNRWMPRLVTAVLRAVPQLAAPIVSRIHHGGHGERRILMEASAS